MSTKARRLLAVAVPAIAILLAGWYCYSPALHGDWLWDDDSYITQNDALRSLAGLKSIWLAPAGVNYFPVTETVQWCQWQLWHNRTTGYHLTNLVLHLLSALLIWRLLRQLGLRQAWLGGLLFAVQPIGVESVAWISELKNTLSLPPLLLAMTAWVAGDSAFHPRYPYRSLLWFVVAMLCKSTVAVFPAMILVYAWWRRGRLARRDWAAAAPFFLVSLALGLVTIWFEHHRAIGGEQAIGGPFALRVAVAGVAQVFYLAKGLIPVRLLEVYPRCRIGSASAAVFLPWLALASILACLWGRRARREERGVLLGLAWFGANLLPILGFIPMAYQTHSWVADHFAYVSVIGLTGLGAAGFERWLAASGPRGRFWPWLAAGLIAAGFAGESRRLAGYYVDGVALWRHTLVLNPGSDTAHNNLGAALAKIKDFSGAIAEYETAIRLTPGYADAHYNLGIALAKSGRTDEAIRQYRESLRLSPGSPKTMNNLGSALTDRGDIAEAIATLETALRLQSGFSSAQSNLGVALEKAGRYAEAIGHYREALRLDPDFAEAWNNLGNSLAKVGSGNEAMAAYREAILHQPDLAEAYFNLGNALAAAGRSPEAIAQYGKAVRLRPDFASFRVNLGDLLAAAGRREEGIAQLRRAVQLSPGSALIHFDLANELFTAGRPEEAATEYQKSLELAPGRPETLNNLGSALFRSGRLREAIAAYQKALRIDPAYADAHANLAQALRREGRFSEAETEIDEARRLDAARPHGGSRTPLGGSP